MKSHALCCRQAAAKTEDLDSMPSLVEAVWVRSAAAAAAAASADLVILGMGFHHGWRYELAAQAGHGRCQQPAGLHVVSCMPGLTLLTCLTACVALSIAEHIDCRQHDLSQEPFA